MGTTITRMLTSRALDIIEIAMRTEKTPTREEKEPEETDDKESVAGSVSASETQRSRISSTHSTIAASDLKVSQPEIYSDLQREASPMSKAYVEATVTSSNSQAVPNRQKRYYRGYQCVGGVYIASIRDGASYHSFDEGRYRYYSVVPGSKSSNSAVSEQIGKELDRQGLSVTLWMGETTTVEQIVSTLKLMSEVKFCRQDQVITPIGSYPSLSPARGQSQGFETKPAQKKLLGLP